MIFTKGKKNKASLHSLFGGFNLNLITIGQVEYLPMKFQN